MFIFGFTLLNKCVHIFIDMANVISSATTVANGSIKKNNFVIGVDTSIGYGPTSATTFWNGIIPPTSGYTVYAQKSVGGPSVRVANNDSELITIAQQYSGTNITTIYDALSYLNSQSNFLVANIDYPSIVTSGMVLNLDAGYVPSYPKTGTTWSDLSGNNNNGTLVNGPTFNSANGGSIVFDGTDDYMSVPSLANTSFPQNAGTISIWYNIQSSGGTVTYVDKPIFDQYDPTTDHIFIRNYYNSPYNLQIALMSIRLGISGYEAVANYSISVDVFHNIVVTYTTGVSGTVQFYIDGVLRYSSAIDSGFRPTGQSVGFGNSGQGSMQGKGNMMHIYNRALSAAEVLQNYNAYKSRFGL